jgi:hypothetical protein
MRELSVNERDAVHGGILDPFIIGGMTVGGVEAGLTLAAAGSALVGAFSVGYAIGTGFYKGYEFIRYRV